MQTVFESIEQKLEEEEENEKEEEEEEEDEEEEEEEEETPRRKTSSPLQKLHKKLEGHLTQLPVVGFNSGKHDINTLKEFLMTILAHDTE